MSGVTAATVATYAGIVSSLATVATSVMGAAKGGPKVPEPPTIQQPPVMPTPDNEAIAAKNRREQAQRAAASGRLSTILTNPSGDHLGA